MKNTINIENLPPIIEDLNFEQNFKNSNKFSENSFGSLKSEKSRISSSKNSFKT